jgi:tetratricopeptide (TPR) repeat protein
VFRDTEELASSADLGDSIRSAIARSEALLVICSPAAAASRWVNEEIKTFRELAPGRDVLCLMVAGSPDPASSECAFPPALLTNAQGEALPEPLAADLRATADGKRGALLKIAAGLLAVGIDDLRQRDQQRKVRFLSAVAAGALAIAVITIGLAISAHYARQEAEVRRTQAEGLIGFMLGDLRNKLQPIGKLDILDAVGDQAMDYFAALGHELSGEDALARVMALRQIGEVRFQQGQLAPALAAFSASRDYARSLHETAPDQDEYLFELGQAEFWVGYVAWERNDLDGADTAFRDYRTISQELAARSPDNDDYTLELSYAVSNLGSVARERGVARDAQRYFQESVEINQKLLKSAPDDQSLQFDLATGLSWLGSTYLDLGDLGNSEAAFAASLDILESLHEGGSNARHSEEFVDVAILLAEVDGHRGDTAAAREHIERGIAVARTLVERDPANAKWREGLYRCEEAAGYVALSVDKPEMAERLLTASMEGLLALLEQDRSSVVLMQRLARVEAAVALLRANRGDMAGAVDLSDQAGERSSAALRDSSGTRKQLRQAMEVALIRGRVLSASGNEVAAREAWENGLALLPRHSDEDPVSLAIRAALHRHLGQMSDADALAKRLAAVGFKNSRYL